jgi:hypothetical protein
MLALPAEYYQQYLGKPGVNEDTAKHFGMIENIDTNFGLLLGKLKDWGIEQNTLVIYFSGDNGGTAGTKIFNAGLHGGKGTPYQGGTRAAAQMKHCSSGWTRARRSAVMETVRGARRRNRKSKPEPPNDESHSHTRRPAAVSDVGVRYFVITTVLALETSMQPALRCFH